MAIPTTIESLSTTAASNGPSGSDQRTLADDGLRQAYAFIKQSVSLATLASAATVTPPSTAAVFSVTGATGISAIASTNSWDGRVVTFVFAGALTITHSANLALPGSANITTVASDVAQFVQTSSGAWRCFGYQRADASPIFSNLTVPGNLTVNGNTTLGNAGTDTVTANGNITCTAPSSGTTLVVGASSGGEAIKAEQSLSGTTVYAYAHNTSNTASSNAALVVGVGGTSAGDPIVRWDVDSGGQIWSAGIDNSDSDIWKLDNSAALTSSTNRLNVTTDGRIYGNALHNNAGSVTGTTNQYIASGTYTPTLTNTTNITSSTPNVSRWIRVGNVVHVTALVSIDPTSGSSATQLGISLPIASSIANTEEVVGVGATNSYSPTLVGAISGDSTNDRATLNFETGSGAGIGVWSLTFSYTVL